MFSKYNLRFCFIIVCFLSYLPPNVWAQEIPSRPSPAIFVNDFAKKLSTEDRRLLEKKLKDFSEQTSNQIVVVIIKSLNGAILEDYSLQLAQSWGIGQRGRDNGILILTTIKERKVRIEVGYGLEGVIPDVLAKRIIDQLIVPHFRAGDFPKAYNLSVDFMIKAIGQKNAGSQEAYESMHDQIELLSEDKEAVFGGRIILYGFYMIVSIGLLGGYASTSFTLRMFRNLNFFVLFVVLGYGEWSSWSRVHGPGFWFFQFFMPLLSLGLLYFFFRKMLHREYRISLLKKYTQTDSKWQKLFNDYRIQEIDETFLKYKDIISREKLKSNHSKRIEKLIFEIQDILKHPAKHINKKSNVKLVKICNQILSADLLKNKKFIESGRDEWLKKINAELAHFKPMEEKDLDAQNQSRMKSFTEKANVLYTKPKTILEFDYIWIEKEVHAFFKDETKWTSYKSSYTSTSVDKTKKTFNEMYVKLQTLESKKDEKYYTALLLLYEKIARFNKSKTTMLTKKPVYVSSSSSSSSSSSYSSSSFSSSSSSFGGGSFGGGGASGSW